MLIKLSIEMIKRKGTWVSIKINGNRNADDDGQMGEDWHLALGGSDRGRVKVIIMFKCSSYSVNPL